MIDWIEIDFGNLNAIPEKQKLLFMTKKEVIFSGEYNKERNRVINIPLMPMKIVLYDFTHYAIPNYPKL